MNLKVEDSDKYYIDALLKKIQVINGVSLVFKENQRQQEEARLGVS